MGRSPCCDKVGLKKGRWTPEEDQKLLAYIDQHGHGSWRALPAKAGLQRCGKSCRLRWTNYLRPDIKRGKFSLQEEQNIIQLHALIGSRWSAIATQLPQRTDNEIKNYWNTHLKKRLAKMGIDPVTHLPKRNVPLGSSEYSIDAAKLNHMAQWESARVETEARLVKDSKFLVSKPYQPTTAGSSSWTQPQRKAAMSLPPLMLKQPLNMMPSCLDILKAWQGLWTNKPNNVHNFNPNVNGTLEFPTSVLNFSDSILTFPSTASFTENSKPQELMIRKEDVQSNNWRCSKKLNDVVDVALLHGIGSFPVDVPSIGDTSSGLPSFAEDLLWDDAGGVFNITGL